MKICIVASNFYPKITKLLIEGAVKEIKKNKFTKYQIIKIQGSFEIPFIISKNKKKFDGFVALGCIIKGQTDHYFFISSAIINTLNYLSSKHSIPIGNGVITCFNKQQALRRANPKLLNKGGDAAKAIMSLVQN